MPVSAIAYVTPPCTVWCGLSSFSSTSRTQRLYPSPALVNVKPSRSPKGLNPFDSSGNAFMDSVKSVKRNGGRVCTVGYGRDSIEVSGFNVRLIHDRFVVGSSLFPIQSIRELADLLILHKVHIDQIVDTKYKLDQAQEAHIQFDTYRSAKIGLLP